MVQTVAIASGKGGVGKTSLAVNCAVHSAINNKRVLLLDADFGLANAHIMLNQKVNGSITNFLDGEKSLDEIIHVLPYGLKLLPGGSGDLEMMNIDSTKRWEVIRSIDHLQLEVDYLFVDTPAGASNSSIEFAAACDKIVIVLVGEPTSFMDAYAFIKALHLEKDIDSVCVVVNMAKDLSEAQASFNSFRKIVSQFLKVELNYVGWLPNSVSISNSILSRKPFVLNEKNNSELISQLSAISKSIYKTQALNNGSVKFFSP